MATYAAPIERPRHRHGDRFEERRRELADAALTTLAELGYARTSLREIAQHSTFSHGVLHYYFTDKVDLITYCVRRYKTTSVLRYQRVVSTADTADQLARDLADGLVTSLRIDARMHRLWYDLRSQAMFEPSFRSDVVDIDAAIAGMIARVADRYAELAGRELSTSPAVTHALLDGLFQQALLGHLSGRASAGDELRENVLRLMPQLLV